MSFSYNDAGLPFKQTSYSDSVMSTVTDQVQDVYNTGIDAAISRVSYQADDAGSSASVHLADYTYLGLSTIIAQR